MKPIDYFKLQAKNLHKDFKAYSAIPDLPNGDKASQPHLKFYDVLAILVDHDIDENDFSLMNAQHFIVQLAGFRNWSDMLKASETELELAKLLFDNRHKISAEEWWEYLQIAQIDPDIEFDADLKLEILKEVFVQVDVHTSRYHDYRLPQVIPIVSPGSINSKAVKSRLPKPGKLITTIPLKGQRRIKFLRVANERFEDVLAKLEPENFEAVKAAWNADTYVDEAVMKSDMLPIDSSYALSLVEAFMLGYVIQLIQEIKGAL